MSVVYRVVVVVFLVVIMLSLFRHAAQCVPVYQFSEYLFWTFRRVMRDFDTVGVCMVE